MFHTINRPEEGGRRAVSVALRSPANTPSPTRQPGLTHLNVLDARRDLTSMTSDDCSDVAS